MAVASEALRIARADLDDPAVRALLAAHSAHSATASPAGSDHALAPEALRAPDVALWVACVGETVAACAALKALSSHAGEVKAMHTLPAFRGRGIAPRLLAQIVHVARERGYERLSLETGTNDAYAAARHLYEAAGFVRCAPFGPYEADPSSAYYTLALTG